MSELNVLVLEDDENLRELLCETLEDEGYRSQGAANGVEAIRKVTDEVFDLLVVDVRMEGMSGLEAFAHMRQQGVELACLVITGYATEEDSIRAIRLGVGDYLRKPFEMRELLQRLARVSAVYVRQRESLTREQRWQRQLDWLHQLHSPADALQAGKLAGQIAASLQLDRLQGLEIQVATALAHQGMEPRGSSDWVQEGLQHWRENWDGSGPRGLAGEAIPLASRIVRLALLASAHPISPRELARQQAGVVDPHLLFTLEFRSSQDHEKQVRRLLDLARGLLYSGQSREAGMALQQAEQLAVGPQSSEVHLLQAGLEPAPLRLQRLTQLIEHAADWGPRWQARMRLESGLLMIEMRPQQAAVWLREALHQLELPAPRALSKLGLWALGQPTAPEWSPLEAIAVLLQPQHEPLLFRTLGWLGPAILRWQVGQRCRDPLLARWLRHYSAALIPALLALEPAQRLQLLDLIQTQPGGIPSGWLQTLAQETDPQVRALALRLSDNKPDVLKPPALHIRSFGTFTVYLAGNPVPERAYRGPRNKILLAYVATSPRPVPEDRVRETFWPEELEKGKKGLYNSLFNLRKALKAEGSSNDCDYFMRQQEHLGLDLELEPWHDLWEVEDGLSQLRSLEWEAFQSELDKIVALTEGTYLDGCYMDWALERRNSLETQLTEALMSGCQKAVERESWLSLHDWSQRQLELDPLNQRAASYRMRALCQLGRPEEALRTFEVVSQRVRQEYELEPTTELMEWAARARLWT